VDVLLYPFRLLARLLELDEQNTMPLPHYQHVRPALGLPEFEEHQTHVVE
jgi:hypothetical protein